MVSYDISCSLRSLALICLNFEMQCLLADSLLHKDKWAMTTPVGIVTGKSFRPCVDICVWIFVDLFTINRSAKDRPSCPSPFSARRLLAVLFISRASGHGQSKTYLKKRLELIKCQLSSQMIG